VIDIGNRGLKLWIPGHPVPQPRMTQKNKWKFATHPIWGWRNLVAWSVKAMRDDSWPLPKGHRVGMGLLFRAVPNHGQVGDLDNYIKGVKDALSKIVYHNDRQVRYYIEPTGIERVEEKAQEGLRLVIQW